MAGSRRPLLRLLAAAAALGAVALLAVSWADRRRAISLLPAGAGIVLEAVDAGGALERIEGTRFAAAFAQSEARAWLEGSAAARALDDARAAIGGATGYTPARRHALDLVGIETALGWYPARGGAQAGSPPWVGCARLSWRAWAIAGALRAAARLGLGDAAVSHEEVAGIRVSTVGSGADATHLFFVGRLVVTGPDRELVRRAARVAAGTEQALVDAEGFKRVFGRLPRPRGLLLWASAEGTPGGWLPRGASQPRAAGAVADLRSPLVADVFVDAPEGARATPAAGGPPPLLALAGESPLFFFSSAGPAPPPLAEALTGRAAQVARRERPGTAAPALPPLGRGYAFAVTSAGEGGLFPRPDGVLAIGMRDAAGAREALRLVFPAGARSAAGRWGTALATRESLPLAGEFELWGAAAGERLVFATQPALIAALEAGDRAGGREEAYVPGAAWPVDTVSSVNVARALPLLRRYAAPLSGLLALRSPGGPDLSRDLGLLAALRTIGVASGTGPGGTLARVTVEVGDLPATAGPVEPRLPVSR